MELYQSIWMFEQVSLDCLYLSNWRYDSGWKKNPVNPVLLTSDEGISKSGLLCAVLPSVTKVITFPRGTGIFPLPVGAASQAISGGLETPICPCNTHQSFIFGVATGTAARSLRLQFSSGWVGHVAPWAGINKQRAVGPDSRSWKVL